MGQTAISTDELRSLVHDLDEALTSAEKHLVPDKEFDQAIARLQKQAKKALKTEDTDTAPAA